MKSLSKNKFFLNLIVKTIFELEEMIHELANLSGEMNHKWKHRNNRSIGKKFTNYRGEKVFLLINFFLKMSCNFNNEAYTCIFKNERKEKMANGSCFFMNKLSKTIIGKSSILKID